jgi:hypothetical protein
MENSELKFAIGVKRYKDASSHVINVTLDISALTKDDLVGWLKNSTSPKVWVQAKLRKYTDMQLAEYARIGYACVLPKAGAKSGFGKVVDFKATLTIMFGAEKADSMAEKFGGYREAAMALAKVIDLDINEDDTEENEENDDLDMLTE